MVDAGTLALFIPLSAIVLGVGAGILKTITNSQERRLETRAAAATAIGSPDATVHPLRNGITP